VATGVAIAAVEIVVATEAEIAAVVATRAAETRADPKPCL
jgi:hypothetical protein